MLRHLLDSFEEAPDLLVLESVLGFERVDAGQGIIRRRLPPFDLMVFEKQLMRLVVSREVIIACVFGCFSCFLCMHWCFPCGWLLGSWSRAVERDEWRIKVDFLPGRNIGQALIGRNDSRQVPVELCAGELVVVASSDRLSSEVSCLAQVLDIHEERA